MTEEEWEAAGLPHEVLEPTGPFHTWRKVLLLGCSCCRFGVSHDQDPGEVIADALTYLERCADAEPWPLDWLERRTGVTELYTAGATRRDLLDAMFHVFGIAQRAQIDSARTLAELVMSYVPRPSHLRDDHAAQAGFVRDIFGNPFYRTTFGPRGRTADVVALASAIYDDRAFDRLPILADALIDAGCDDEQILAHCRSDGPHVRGCWVVDLVLGKS